MSESRRVFISLGGNVGDVRATLDEALFAIDEIPQTTLRRQSGFYRTPAWGNTEQADFLNCVAELQTRLSANVLLEKCLEIEERFGRIRSQAAHWQPRTLDIDILLFGDENIQLSHLRVPHPFMHERAFVLVPLAELSQDLEIPGHGLVKHCLAKLDISGIVAIE